MWKLHSPIFRGIAKNLELHWLFPWLLVFFTFSCASSQTQVKMPVKVPEEFSLSGKKALPDQWWLSFDDPDLNELIDQALSNNFSLRSTWDRLAQAEAAVGKAGAGRFPTLDAELSASRTNSQVTVGSSGVLQKRNSSTFLLGLFASYELDLWGRVRSTHQAFLFDVHVSGEDLHTAAITLSAQVASTWYQLVEQYGQLELLNRQLETNEQVLELVTFRFRHGKVEAVDVLQQRQLVESIRGDITTAKSRALVLEHQLAILLGLSPDTQVADPITQLVQLPLLPDTGVAADLIRRRPDIRRAYYKVLASDQRVAAAIADRFPRISLSTQVNTNSGEVRNLFNNWLATLAANVLAPIIDGGTRKAEVDRTRAIASQSLNEYGEVILNSLGEVEDALTQEQKQRDLIESLNKQLELSQLVIQRLRDSYTHGAVDYLRVLTALLSNQGLERDILQARRELVEFRIDLCRSLAGGWVMSHPKSLSWVPQEGWSSEVFAIHKKIVKGRGDG